jgi:hypothetical protein
LIAIRDCKKLNSKNNNEVKVNICHQEIRMIDGRITIPIDFLESLQ